VLIEKTVLAHSYDYRLVAVSVVIAISASYAALDLAGRVTAAQGRARYFWLAGGAMAMGLGIWSMHYIGMLALKLSVPVQYDWRTVLASLLAAILAAMVALYVVSRQRMGLGQAAVGCVVMGAGIATMHYTGMAAMRMAAMCEYDPLLVIASIVLAVVCAFVALWLAFYLRDSKGVVWRKLLSALVMGLAIPLMHYTGMAAVRFTPSDLLPDFSNSVSVTTLGTAGITLVTMIVLALAILSAVLDRVLSGKVVEIALAEERYRLLFERSPAGMIRTTLDGKILTCNDACARIYGYSSQQELVGLSMTDRWPSQDDRRELVAKLKREKSVVNHEYRMRRKDGSTVWVLFNHILFENKDDGMEIVEGALIEITEWKQAEQRLRLSEAMLATAQRIAHLGSFEVDLKNHDGPDRPSVKWSDEHFRIFGYEPGQIETSRSAFIGALHPDDRERVMNSLAGNNADIRGGYTHDYRILRPDGTTRIVHSEANCICDEQTGEPLRIIGTIQDITENKNLEGMLHQAQKLEAVGALAAGIAHEINTPIQFIGDNARFVKDSFAGILELIDCYDQVCQPANEGKVEQEAMEQLKITKDRTDWEYLRAEVPKALDQLLDGVSRVAKIVRAMKEFSHVDQSAEKSLADLNKALESTLVVANNELKYVANVVAEYGELPVVNCHLGDLNQVFLNLLVNAAHAIGDVRKNPGEMGCIAVRTRRDGEWVEVAISDTGTGIPEAVRNRIFDPFFTTKEVGKGSGQGLALARAIVEGKHGGTITFETEMGKGTTFFVRLPLSGVAEPKEAVTA